MSTAYHLLNQELRPLLRTPAAYDILVRLAREAANSGVLQSSVDIRRSAFQKLDRVITEGMDPVRSRRDSSVSRSGKTASFESCHVVVVPEVGETSTSRQFRLSSIRLHVAHDEIAVEKLPLQAVFRFHAGEQMFTRSDLRSDYFRSLASEIAEWYCAIKVADSVLDEAGRERFTIPGPGTEGFMMGYLDQSAAIPAGELLRFARGQEKAHVIGASPFAPGLFTANTYIGLHEIRPEQQALRECWIEWKRYFDREYQPALERELWPFREISPVEKGHVISQHAIDAVRAFLLDPRALRAMQNKLLADRVRGPVHDDEASGLDIEVAAPPLSRMG